MKDYLVVNSVNKTIIAECDNPQEAWTAWQNAWFPLKTNSEREAIKHGKIKSMLKYLK